MKEESEIKKLCDDRLSINEISIKLNKTYSQVRYLLKKYKLKTKGCATIYNWEKEFIINNIEKSECKSDLLRNMGVSIRSGNFQTLDRYCKLYSIDISHFKYKNNRGNRFKKTEDEFVFIENSMFTSSYKLKKRVINSGYLENKCYKCGNEGMWCEEPLSLQIDHINGINNDHRLVNLRIACPNCHSQTLTYRGKKNRIIKPKKKIELKLKFNITKEKLSKLVWEIPTIKIAKMFNVSDSAISKRCKNLGIQKPERGYWSKKS